ncbi:hypothetical protein [Saccharopolyspora spinosa]|uniref:hypothetical protein n=1 Tax=Saccharopolyspora spinosa TaxID=60894 RepID=UPI001EED3A9D|nr:hypothetical protein [Saccharopolyspora spinosa]
MIYPHPAGREIFLPLRCDDLDAEPAQSPTNSPRTEPGKRKAAVVAMTTAAPTARKHFRELRRGFSDVVP